MNEIVASRDRTLTTTAHKDQQVLVTVYVEKQLFGIPVEEVRDVLVPEKIARVPLAPPDIAGAINLRGRIVTVIDVRARLRLPERKDTGICTTVEYGENLYGLLVDSMGAVLSIETEKITKPPPTLAAAWRDVSAGITRLDDNLMLVLDVERFLAVTP